MLMRLVFLKYLSGGKWSHGLFLILEDTGDHMVMLKSSDMPANEKSAIRQQMAVLTGLETHDRVTWLRKHCPESCRKAYRKLSKRNVVIINDYTDSIK